MVLPLAGAGPAVADTTPVAPATRATVSADALPTVQINGVAWAQVVIGDTVYVTGDFSSARPAGSAAGQNETPRANILAYDLSTGKLRTDWAPTLDAQGLALAASPDGKLVYVGGDFTKVSGVVRNRIAALDATTGKLVSTFVASVNTRVRALTVSNGVLYAGGLFTTSGGQARDRLAAFDAATGTLQSWNPGADREVLAIVVPPKSNKVVVSGRFSTLGGVDAQGMGAVAVGTGASLPWPVNEVIRNAGDGSSINSLSTDGTRIFGTGYNFKDSGNLESAFAADLNGNLVWASSCRGDTYSSAPIGGVLYTVSHAHDCSYLGGWPETDPQTFQRAVAFSTTPGTYGQVNVKGNTAKYPGKFTDRPAPELLHWLPTLSVGSFTGQFQAAWNVTGNSQYVALGGEFLAVNGVRQQGLTRFAVKSEAPNQQGPLVPEELTLTAKGVRTGALRLTWAATWDRDSRWLTYELLRDGKVVGTQRVDSSWWERRTASFTDLSAPAKASVTYQLRAKDADGNTVTGPELVTAAPASKYATDTYANSVRNDGATAYWRLGESSGTNAYNWNSARDLTLDASVDRAKESAIVGGMDRATRFNGGTTGVSGTTKSKEWAPQEFSEELWFRTASTAGGKLLGFGTNSAANSARADRQIWMGPTGKVSFGVRNGGVTKTVTSSASFNNAKWHHVVATLGSTGMRLYVDGKSVATDTKTTFADPYPGYWRVGGDTLNDGYTNRPTRGRFNGELDEIAVYPTTLSSAKVTAHYKLGGR